MRISDWSSDVCSSDLLVGQSEQRVGDGSCVCWSTALIGHNAQFRTAGGKLQHGADKVVAMCTEHPGHAQNQVLWKPRTDGFLAFPLALTIDTQRSGGGIFRIRGFACTVKDVIRGNMKKRTCRFGAHGSAQRGAVAKSALTCLGCRFRPVP